MGWGSARDIFDEVAWSLVHSGADEDVLDQVCTKLARALMDDDWDTDDESIDEFSGHPVVQHAIRRARGRLRLRDDEGDRQGELRHVLDEEPGEGEPIVGTWLLLASDGSELVRTEGTWEGFNVLVQMWAVADPSARAEAADAYLLR